MAGLPLLFSFSLLVNPKYWKFAPESDEFPGVADEVYGWSDVDGTLVDERRVCNSSVTDCRRPCVLWYKDVVAPERVLSNPSCTILLISSVAESFSLVFMFLNKIKKIVIDSFVPMYLFLRPNTYRSFKTEIEVRKQKFENDNVAFYFATSYMPI